MMKKNEKKMIIGLIIVSIIIIGIIFCITHFGKQEITNNPATASVKETKETQETVQVEDYRVKINPETTIEESQEVGGLEVGNVQMQYMGEETVIVADIKNTTSETIESSPAVFRLLNNDGDVIGEMIQLFL